MIKIKDFLIDSSFEGVKLSNELMMEGIRLVITVRFQFGYRDISILIALFGFFRWSGFCCLGKHSENAKLMACLNLKVFDGELGVRDQSLIYGDFKL